MVKFGKKEEIRQGDKEISNWLQKLEQEMESLEKRLDAVERRLSNEPLDEIKMPKLKGEENRLKNMEKEILFIKENLKNLKREPLIVLGKKDRKGEAGDKKLDEILQRLEKLEKRKATIKVGRIEVPIEITGIVGGVIAFVIAALLRAGYKEFVISPDFVAGIGIILILAAALKTYAINRGKR